jgi:DnaJ-class molecular chaperone
MTLVRNSYKQICQEADSLKEGTMAYEEKNKCDGCGGTGVVDDDIYDDDNRRCEKTCDVCGGSGYED